MSVIPPGSFPLASVPPAKWSWRSGMRAFGANRSGNRAHAGCDLYAPAGTAVYAVADGTVRTNPYPFYAGTFALEIVHAGIGTVRYGEIAAGCALELGDHVAQGQPIARVGHLQGISVPSDMLHFEVYVGTSGGPLTTSATAGAKHVNGRPFMRRRDLANPTPYLDAWSANLPGGTPTPTLREGSTGEAVARLQAALKAAGDYNGRPDGVFGRVTTQAVKAYQTRKRLTADGIVGKGTWTALERDGL